MEKPKEVGKLFTKMWHVFYAVYLITSYDNLKNRALDFVGVIIAKG